MKRVYILFFVSFLLIGTSFYLALLLKQRAVSSLKTDASRITEYAQWGYNTPEFDKMYNSLISDADAIPVPLYPFQTAALTKRHDNILRLVQAGYATEITTQKEALRARLSYLRDRVKSSISLPDEKKQQYFNSFEVVAVETFEKNSDLHSIEMSFNTLKKQDETLTKEIETYRRESLISELQGYKKTCEDLYLFFQEKKSKESLTLAANCINEAEQLLTSANMEGGGERVFARMQKASSAKQKIVQQEQYALELKRKEEERLSIVPPALSQEGKLVVVNLALQRLYAYENGKSIFLAAVPITTGKYGFETVTGEFAIYLKEQQHKMVSPFPGIFYDDMVNYWMPFYLGYGLHDAPWRGIYGTQDYPVVGSHGCVNMPLNSVAVLYNWAEVGTRVIVI